MEPRPEVQHYASTASDSSAEEAEHRFEAFRRWCRFVQLRLEEWLDELEHEDEHVVEQVFPLPRRFVPSYSAGTGLRIRSGEPLASTSAGSSSIRCSLHSAKPGSPHGTHLEKEVRVEATSKHTDFQLVFDVPLVAPPTKRFRKRAKTKS